jgi:hypothetical protein
MINSLIDEPIKLLEFIDSCLKPKETEKKRFGEVFTPMKLVNEMLDKLPKKVWSDKTLKWLDPANGMGNYPIAVYLRLMKGLAEEIPSKSKRKRHILEKMLYMCELNSKNVHMCRQILDAGNQYKLNLHCGDFLEFDSMKVFGVDKFDIVMGNPPYQSGTTGVRKGGYGGRALWEIFVQTVLDRDLKKNGYLVFVHPSNWRKPEHKMWEVFTSRQIIHLDIHGEKEGIKVFRASTRYDWYVLQNKECNKETTIHDEEGKTHKIDLREWSFLPNYMYNEISEIIVPTNGCEVIYSRSLYGTDKKNMSKIKNKQFNTKVIHSMTQKGIGYWYTNDTTKGHFKEPKVVLSFGRHQYPYNDYKGKYGMSQIVYGLPIKNKSEGDKIVAAINSDAFKKIILATKWNTFYTEWRMFKYFKKDFYKQFQSKSVKKVDISDSDDEKQVPNKKRTGKMISGKAKKSTTRSTTSKRSD